MNSLLEISQWVFIILLICWNIAISKMLNVSKEIFFEIAKELEKKKDK